MKSWGLLLLAASACRTAEPETGQGSVVVEARPSDGLDISQAQIEGPVRSATVLGPRLVVELSHPGKLVVRAPGACPLAVEVSGNETLREKLSPLFDIPTPGVELGFDAQFEIRAKPNCPEATFGEIEWRQTRGAPLRQLRIEDGGRLFAARTARFEDLASSGGLPWGIVPLSPRTRGEAELEARYARHVRTIRIAAAARSRGLPNVATGTRLYLSSADFHVVSRPSQAAANVEHASTLSWLRPDASGTWVLSDSAGRSLRLVSRRYDETPLDCTRSDCHRAIDASSRGNPMTSILQRGMDSRLGSDYPACAGGCHALGEPGLDDGGFFAVAGMLGYGAAELHRTDWHELPPSLRRLGGVGCLACHGPGAIPEESARSGILRADVCATCHDAPPEYGHVTAWRTTRMSRADADPRVSDDTACARCHTTWGFLGSPERRPPRDIGPVGIACAACHAVHPDSRESASSAGRCEESLARKPAVPTALVGSFSSKADRSRVCLACHTASPGEATPSGTAANLWLGRGGLDPATGVALDGPAPLADLEGGCIGCHHTGPTEVARGATHAFRAERNGPGDPKIAERARSIWARLQKSHVAVAAGREPSHATGSKIDTSTPLGRASWDVALVLEDRAADAHNPAYGKRLLDVAEGVLPKQNGGTR